MAQNSYDVLIAGGGPAGLSAGIVLARCGLQILVCEKRRYPVDKVCGEGIMPTGVAALRAFGIDQHLQHGAFHEFQGITYLSPHGVSASTKFSEGPGWGIHRPVLSAALKQCAEETPGLTVRSDTQIASIERIENRVTVHTSSSECLNGRLLIGADGRDSKIRRWTGLDGPPQTLKRWGVRQHFNLRPWSPNVEVYWGDGVEAYVTPCGSDLVEIAFLWDRDRYNGIRSSRLLIPNFIDAFPRLRERVGDATSEHDTRAVGPLRRTATSPVGDGVLLIGDAAGYLDAITGEGLSLAFAQAMTLSETIGRLLLKSPDHMPTENDLKAYRRAYQKIVRPHLYLTRLVLSLSRHPHLAEKAIRILRNRPDVFQSLLSINMGNIPPIPRLSTIVMNLLSGMISREAIAE